MMFLLAMAYADYDKDGREYIAISSTTKLLV